ncbi:Uncharacterized protein PECH_007928 [Penicillium ucsense]|uniref:Glutamyl-tRNA synthetase n=1 Tax=Penicillium ucsense TaxID=2839758 RepID=A0A8J8WHU4_9EURO|nr:Uncharacterized protein PECM_007076 [Penicillium ucsense]KAF7734561.1 Uncharacterized protein PECH_007928 [Penicillium ucsense]
MSDKSKYELALSKIDAAHSDDPNRITLPKRHPTINTNAPTPDPDPETTTIPYELHYAQKMTYYLTRLDPLSTSTDLLRLAIRAQHLRRWEIPRSSYPPTKPGYHAWRAELQRRQAALAEQICRESGYTAQEAGRVGALVRKEGLRKGPDRETQMLEDVACLVFLDDQLDGFGEGLGDEEKMVGILRKSWGKMSEEGRREALTIEMSEKGRELVKRALEG